MLDLNKINQIENMADISDAQIAEAVKRYYLSDEFIKNISLVSAQLQSNGLNVPGPMNIKGKMNVSSDTNAKDFPEWLSMSVENTGDSHIRLKTKNDDGKNIYLINRDGHFKVHAHGVGDMLGVNHDGHHHVRHLGDHVMHVEGDGNYPYISLGKTGTWGGKKIYIQNVDAHTDVPTFRVGVHDKGAMMDMSQKYGVRWARKDGRWSHLDHEDGKNYLRGETIHDGNVHVNGGVFCINGKCINESHLSMLVDGFKLTTGAGGHHSGAWMHTHKDGVMRIADPVYRTVYKPYPQST